MNKIALFTCHVRHYKNYLQFGYIAPMDFSESHGTACFVPPQRSRLRAVAMIVSSVITLSIFAWLAVQVRQHVYGIPTWDQDISAWMHARHSPLLTAIALFLAAMGSIGMMALVAISGLVAARVRPERWATGWALALGTLGAWGLIDGIKFLAHRPRPSLYTPLIPTGGYSFPSGHALIGVAVYGLLAHMLLPRVRNRSKRVLLGIVSAIFALSIGVSRVYLGVHYPSDVLAGWCLALPWLFLCIGFHDTIARRSKL